MPIIECLIILQILKIVNKSLGEERLRLREQLVHIDAEVYLGVFKVKGRKWFRSGK